MLNEDEEVLKSLVSDTRREILSEGDRTPSDLSRMLDKSKSTIVEHLEKLINAGLVEKIERPGYKWVFYSLTKKGESYVSKKDQRLVIILSTVFLSIIGGVFSMIGYLTQPSYRMAINDKTLEAPELVTNVGGGNADAMISATPWFLYLSIGLFVIALIGIFVLIMMKRKKNWEI